MSVLSELLSSRSRAEVLRILFGTASGEVHLREIQRQAGLAIGTIRQETTRLEKLELIQSRKSGNRLYYSANQRNPLFATIHELVLKTTGLADILAQHLVKDETDFAFVFGSFARGEARPESDIDLFVIGKIGLRALSRQLSEPSRILGREINPHVMEPQEFIKRKTDGEHFVSRVLESKKIMVIGNEDDLSKLGDKWRDDSEYLDSCRIKRNAVEYEYVGGATAKEADELIAFVEELKTEVLQWLATHIIEPPEK